MKMALQRAMGESRVRDYYSRIVPMKNSGGNGADATDDSLDWEDPSTLAQSIFASLPGFIKGAEMIFAPTDATISLSITKKVTLSIHRLSLL
ncbi:hypothetical protein AWENTII_003719 [Aspergillus wentii]